MIFIVTGANYGDEGKGNIVSYLAQRYNKDALVIRHNGGSQAQHRVVHKDGTFIFGHLGSGTLSGVTTFLSKYFITNPLILRKELDEYNNKISVKPPKLIIDGRSRVTTIFDMIFNQSHSDMLKHGTCGIGVKTTIDRNEVIPLSVYDCLNLDRFSFKNIIREIKNYYLKKMNYMPEKIDMIDTEKHADELETILSNMSQRILRPDEVPTMFNKVSIKIFEGAQGLLLSQDNFSEYPHLTPSSTGIANAERIILEESKNLREEIEYIYVTRTYLTRHGNGQFDENTVLPNTLVDVSNVKNEFQGEFRIKTFTNHDIELLLKRVKDDAFSSIISSNMPKTLNLALTHVDQLYENNDLKDIAKYISMGPSHTDVYMRDSDWLYL